MKIKNLTIFSVAVAVLCTAARTATLAYTTESSTGFFITRLSSLGISLSAGIFLLTLLAVTFAFTAKEPANSPFNHSKTTGCVAVILGLSIIFYALGFNAHSYLIQWQHTLETVTGILAGIWFVLFGISSFLPLKLPKITTLIPCIHSIMRLIVVFSALSTSALVAEHVFSLAYHVSVMVFMLSFGRMAAGEPSKNSAKSFFPIAVCSFVFTCTSTFSRLIMLLLNKAEMIHGETALDLTGIILSIFILLIAHDICKEKNTQIKEADFNDI